MWGRFGWVGFRQRAAARTEADLRGARIAAFDAQVAQARNSASERLVRIVLGPVMILLGFGYLAVGLAQAASVDWDLDRWVHGSRSGGPLLFVYIASGLICVLLVGAGIGILVAAGREGRIARLRMAELEQQQQKDLAAQRSSSRDK
jgi:uncharacterized membrane protein YidH (DUF202 family)